MVDLLGNRALQISSAVPRRSPPAFFVYEENMNERSRFEHNPKVLCAALRIEPPSRLMRRHLPAKSGASEIWLPQEDRMSLN
jgi:hypothetical protein